jgi:UDPglucose 6-dehydrogenase
VNKKPKISVIGSGYVGTTTAAILANCNYAVTAIDTNKNKVAKINSGLAPFFEEGLDALIKNAVNGKSLKATTSYQDITESDIVFSCVGTPDNPDGSSNLEYVFSCAEEALKQMKNSAIFVQKSTVPVGTGAKLIDLFNASKKSIYYVSNPEFLREGTAIYDSLWFDRVVVGSENKDSATKIIDLYKDVEKQQDKIGSIAGVINEADNQELSDYFITSLSSAELIKVTSNAFLAMKISFANNIAMLADKSGANIIEVMEAVGSDKRIGRAFLNAGRGYGGGCFPKDVSGLIKSAESLGVDIPIMHAVEDINNSMPGYIVNKAQTVIKDYKNKNIAVLGLAFKAGTSDARRSPGVNIANLLTKYGAKVKVYDPQASQEAKEDLDEDIKITKNISDATNDAEAVFITTNWSSIININLAELSKKMNGKLFVDCTNSFNSESVKQSNLIYIGVGNS